MALLTEPPSRNVRHDRAHRVAPVRRYAVDGLFCLWRGAVLLRNEHGPPHHVPAVLANGRHHRFAGRCVLLPTDVISVLLTQAQQRKRWFCLQFFRNDSFAALVSETVKRVSETALREILPVQ